MTVMDTSLEILEALDFDPEHECEHSNHGKVEWHHGPARFLVHANPLPCPDCGRADEGATFALCQPAWVRAGVKGLVCALQGCTTRVPRDTVWTIVGEL